MSSRAAEPRSIASQLVVLFTLAAAFLLSCGIGALYWIVIRHAFEEDNEVLADKVAAIQADLSAASGPKVLSEQLKNIRPGERAAYWVRVIDSMGATVTETPGMRAILPSAIFPNPSTNAAPRLKPTDFRAQGRLFSLVASAHEVAGQKYTVEVAQDRSADERFMKQFAALLVAVLILGIIASTFIALTVTKRGLRPLREMTAALQRIGPTELHERVSSTGWPREIQPLADAFDAMLARLEESFRKLSQFSADLAHELRTPIGNIRGEAEVALTRPRTAEEYRAVVESTVAECAHLAHIVDNLLFLARTEAAEAHLERTHFSGRAAIEKIVAFYEPMAEEQMLSVNCVGDASFFADEMLFGRAVSNLLENALRYTPSKGAVEIALTEGDRSSEVAVRDNGAGIAPEHLPRVFDRFYRADPSRSSEGLGLGLALVKSIVELHGGTATIESASGRGTTVRLAFPKA
ncbi:MAG TPA: heavy metal sensor histidine kinase [Chthoniobacterales bacterium]|nr:heavy metal sensor histidine kinase [Chthoniobacterales bacterium]